jgi:hypothetical protein
VNVESAAQALVDNQVAQILEGNLDGWQEDELAALSERISEAACRATLLRLARRLQRHSRQARIEAERDGWREIATELLGVAMGPQPSHACFGLPPLELIHLASRTDRERWVPALAQFWRDLTMQHEERRRTHGDWACPRCRSRYGGAGFCFRDGVALARVVELEVGDDIEAGQLVVVGDDGRARSGGRANVVTVTSANPLRSFRLDDVPDTGGEAERLPRERRPRGKLGRRINRAQQRLQSKRRR